ncbi:MAG: site-2 protease family protein [Planctomycetota bacterium]
MDFPIDKLIVVLLVVYTITLHELAHAWAATWAGDPTPGKHGRLTWNPIVQLHPVYSVVMPLITYLLNGWPIGFAYCPIDPSRFRKPLRDRALVGLAGPLVNFAVSLLCVGLMWLPFVVRPDLEDGANATILFGLAFWNLLLGLFNMLPLPGLDGYDVIRPILPLAIRQPLDRFRTMGFLPLLLALMVGGELLGLVATPAIRFFFAILPAHVDAYELFHYWLGRG